MKPKHDSIFRVNRLPLRHAVCPSCGFPGELHRGDCKTLEHDDLDAKNERVMQSDAVKRFIERAQRHAG